ncbi:hypothetical protein U0035_18895 [Niabella yanshanensis]|uniref:DUF4958 domain-containing protein n=1 Tax=Niabella yanshanensis TaxID=577386 RepID=A0ABZ0W3A5_9BACT|nr:hypothetical protein [Niabella yanshanensis]WQD37743.1 hypothetical protein U0035_18895 [Niabella yanshanensis]
MNYLHLIRYALFFCTILGFATGCGKKEWVEKTGNGPDIKIDAQYANIARVNVGDVVTIPITVSSTVGVKRLSYYFINQTANGTTSEAPVHADNTDYPSTLTKEIQFTIRPAMVELVVVSFDKNNNSSEVHIRMSEIRALPVMTFKDGIKFQETVFEKKRLNVQGQITSTHDLSKISYRTIINGVLSAETAIPFTDKKSTAFVAALVVPKGLTDVIITAANIYDGNVVDTFKVGRVADDAVSIALAGISGTIPYLYADSLNVFSGQVSSGSDLSSLSYAIKTGGVYGAEQSINLGTPPDEFSFTVPVQGAVGMEAIRISGRNAGGKEQVLEYPIGKVNRRLLRFTNIVLTTEIGPGKNNWFSAYKAPHVFDVTNAAAAQEMIDFGTIIYNNAFRFVPPFIYTAGAAYQTAAAPYMEGFTKATYTLVTANRRSVTPAAMDSLLWDSNLDNFINVNIKGPGPVGENYNVSTTNRRVSADPVTNTGVIIGWGSWNLATGAVNNQAFGVVLVKSYTTTGSGRGAVTIDVVVPAENQRARFNLVSMLGYPSP